jgi:hypothetical protein
MKIFVSKNGQITGPYGEQEVIGLVDAGHFAESDLAMTEGLEDWTPLGSIIIREVDIGPFKAAIAHITRTADVYVKKVISLFIETPVVVGVVSVLFGCLLIFLCQWPVLIYGPFLLGALVAGVILLRRQQMVLGIVLLTLAIILPLVILE